MAFVSEASGHPEVRLGSISGGESRGLGLDGQSFPAAPDPKGTHVLVIRTSEEPEGHRESMWMVPVSGGEATQIGPVAEAVRNPAWSPDGTWLVFESSHDSFRDLYRVGRDGSEPVRLTKAPHGSFEPAVGPDGRIAFVSSRDGNAEIYVMKARGGSPKRITNDPTDDMLPAWSPDGKTLTWLRREGEAVHLWKQDAMGTGPFVAPVSGEVVVSQGWSPDGSRIALTVNTGREVSVQIVAADRLILDGPGPDEHPTWSPDGRYLVFSSAREGRPNLYRVAADGSGLTRITEDPTAAWLPRWLTPPR